LEADEAVAGSTGEFPVLGGFFLAHSGDEHGVADEFFSGSSGDATLLEPAIKRFEISGFRDQDHASISH
jgi:hypothetical protein